MAKMKKSPKIHDDHRFRIMPLRRGRSAAAATTLAVPTAGCSYPRSSSSTPRLTRLATANPPLLALACFKLAWRADVPSRDALVAQTQPYLAVLASCALIRRRQSARPLLRHSIQPPPQSLHPTAAAGPVAPVS
jgi:hypothetical protein